MKGAAVMRRRTHTLDEVMAEFGLTHEELDATPDWDEPAIKFEPVEGYSDEDYKAEQQIEDRLAGRPWVDLMQPGENHHILDDW